MPSDQFLRAAEFHRSGFWGDETLPDVINRWADEDPDRRYVSDGTSSLTYGQAREQAWTLAANLAALGIGPGDRVAVQLPNWNEFFLGYAACARLGAIIVPVVPVYRKDEVGFIVENSGATALVSCGEFNGFDHAAMAAEIVDAAGHQVTQIVVRGEPRDGALAFGDLLTAGPARRSLPEPPSADDRHIILYSSGTEARSKGCLHTWNTSSFLAKQAIPAMGMNRDDTMFMPLPVTHALGLTLAVMAPTLAGASAHLMDVFDPQAALERIAEHRCTGTASPAPFLRMMLDAYDPGLHDVSRLRFWLTAGAPIPASLVEDAADRFTGCRVVSAYGSSEVTIATACRPEDPVERVANTDGALVPGVELRIVADGKTVPAGVDGEIRYRGPGRLLEYWARPDLTAACIDSEGWWRTGDVGRLDDRGYLRVTGRIKDIIIRGGFNISAREVEDALLVLPEIRNIAVVGLPDPAVGERVCAVIQPASEHEPPTLARLRDYLGNERGMAVWKIPEQLEIAAGWPVTATGKVKKYVLRQAIEAAQDLYAVRWTPARRPAGAGPGTWAVDGDGPAAVAVRQALHEAGARLVAEPGSADTVVRCLPAPPPGADLARATRQLAAAGLAELAARAAASGTSRLVWVTSNAVAVGPADPVTGIAQSAMWGLARVARAEHPGLALQIVDADDELAPSSLLAAVTQDSEPEVAVRGEDVLVPRLVRAAGIPIGRSLSLGDGTVLITGGLGEAGARIARRLAGLGVKRLLLVSRRGADDPRSADAVAALGTLGARADVAACDVADAAGLRALLAGIDPAAPLRGVVHCAGAADDGAITELTPERLDKALRAQVDGACHLDLLTRALPVDMFALVSSAAGGLGLADQGAQAAASAFLDQLAARRCAGGRAATSVAFGGWPGAGPAAADALASAGFPPLAPERGIDLFELAVLRGAPSSVALAVDAERVRRSHPGGVPPLWRTLLPAPAARPASEAASQPTDFSALPSADRLLALVSEEAAEALGLPSARDVRPDQRFGELGLESVTALELRSRIAARVGTQLPSSLLFDCPTPRALSQYLLASALGLQPAPASQPAAATRSPDEPIAVVSMSCRLPGGIATPGQLWQLLREGGDAIGPFPADRWDVDALYDPDPEAAGKVSAREGGFLPGIDAFDARLFGITPREAFSMDPQQRLLLETAWEAMERAGIVPGSLAGSLTGVYVGVMASDYLAGAGLEQLDGYFSTGSALSVASGRLAYTFGFTGPAVSVDTACSSSLFAVHLAASGLRAGECDLALVGGVTVMTTPRTFVEFSRLRGLSPGGRCRTFSDDADGTGFAEGAAMLVLKRLSDARRDGDDILALIRGTAANQDGHSQGLSVPFGPAQQDVIRMALARSALAPADIDYLEAHGTGTTLGDPIEANALSGVFGPTRPPGRPLYLGSLKSNIGHTQAAAGAASLVKVILALGHEELPRTLHVTEPTRHVSWEGSGLQLVREPTPWPHGERSRRAGVSAFGVSGTNVHVVVEEAPSSPRREQAAAGAGSGQLFLVSGRDDAALRRQAARLAEHLAGDATAALGDVAAALARGRTHFGRRAAVIARDRDKLASGLGALAAGRTAAGVISPPDREPVTGKLAFVVPGHSPLWAGMGAGLLAGSPAFAEAAARCETEFARHLGWPVGPVLRGADGAPDPARVEVAHAALFTMNWALAEVWRSFGVTPDAVIGHSLGEIAAAQIAGALTFEQAAAIAAARGLALRPAEGQGGALSVQQAAGEIEGRLAAFDGRLTVAAVNGSHSTTVSGDLESLAVLEAQLASAGVAARPVPVAFAVHSPQMDPIAADLRRKLAAVTGAPSAIPMYSTVLGEPVPGDGLDAGYWARNLRDQVRFAATVRRMLADGFRYFVEVSAHPSLGGVIRSVAEEAGVTVVTAGSLRRDEGGTDVMLGQLAQLTAAGYDLDWSVMFPAGSRAELPTYAFERQRFWSEPAARPAAGQPGAPLVQAHVEDCDHPGRHVVQAEVDLREPRFTALADHQIDGGVLLPGAAYLEMALEASSQLLPGERLALADVRFERPLALQAGAPARLQMVIAPPGADGGRRFTIAARAAGATSWVRHVAGRLEPATAGAATEPPAAVRARCADQVDVPAFYARLRSAGIQYGPAFRLLAAGWRDRREAVGQLAQASVGYGGVIDPALLDAAFHVAALPLDMPSGVTFVPAAAGRVTLTGAGTRPVWAASYLRSLRDGRATLDLRLFDEQERLVLAVDGFEVTELPQQDGSLHEVRWKARPAAAGPAVSGSWLILADESGAGQRLSVRLGAAPHVIARRGRRFTARDGRYRIDPANPAHLERLLTEAFGDVPPARIVVLSALDAPPVRSADTAADAARLTCTTLARVVQSVTARPWTTAPRLFVVTRASQAAGGSGAVACPEQALAWGFGTAIAQEHPQLRTTVIDLPAEGGLEALCDELEHADDEQWIALRDGGRRVPRLARTRPDAAPEALRADRTYLVTGGLGGLGRAAAGQLAGLGARHLAVLGRSAPSGEAAQWLQAMDSRGIAVHVLRGDVADRESLAAALDTLRQAAPPIGGVVHAAGVLDDATLTNVTAEQIARVLAPKVLGTALLTELIPDADFLVLFSSAASLIGSPGQSAYSAANAFLDAWAHHLATAGRPALSLDWGAWSGTGMAAATQDRAGIRQLGLGEFSPGQGGELFARLLGSTRRQLAPIALDRAQLGQQPGLLATRPMLADLASAAGPPAASSELPGQIRAAASAGQRRELIETYLRATIAAITAADAAGIAATTPLKSLDLDSLMRVTLNNTIARDLAVALPSQAALAAPDISSLADTILAAPADTAAAGQAVPSGETDAGVPPVARRPATRDVIRLLRAEQHATPPATHAIGFALRLAEPTTRDRLTAILARLAARHAALRTAIVAGAEHDMQLETHAETGELLTWSAVEEGVDVQQRLHGLLEPPFDLSRPPLWRFELLESASGEQVLIYGAHHAVSDAASLLLVMAELGAELGGTPLDGALSNQDIERLVQAQAPPEASHAEENWREEFTGSRRLDLMLTAQHLPARHLPARGPAAQRPATRSYRAGSMAAELPEGLFTRLSAYAAQLGVTPAAVCLGTLTVLLARLRRHSRFVLAVPVDTRMHADAFGALGYFGVPIPFPAEVRDGEPVADVLRRTDGRLVRVLSRGVSFVDAMTALVEEGLHRDGAPLVEVYFNYLRAPGILSGTVQPVRVGTGWSDLDLMVTVAPDLGQVWLDYNTDIIDEPGCAGLARDYLSLLAGIIDGAAADAPALPAGPGSARLAGQDGVALAATFALGDLPAMLSAALDDGTPVLEAPYHQVLASLHDPSGVLSQATAAGVVLLRAGDLARFGPVSDELLAELAEEYPAALRALAGRTAAPLVLGFLPDRAQAQDDRLRQWERDVAARLEDHPGLTVLGPGDWIGDHPGGERFDAETDAAAHLPFRPEFQAAAALALAAVLRALCRKPPKVIAVDGDNTLWSGVAGELGAAGVELNGGRETLARRLLAWREAGALLALTTNNDEATVLDVLARRDSLLRAGHFSVISPGWEPKSARLQAAARQLGLGLDSFLFLDDNPVEIAAVRSALPEVLCVTCPPAGQLDAFLRRLWPAVPRAVTSEDAARAEFYQVERLRDAERQQTDFAEFLRRLDLHVEVSPLSAGTLTRSVQLSRRTSQFNLRPLDLDEAALTRWQQDGEVWTATARDRFGDYGQVGLLVLRCQGATLEVAAWMLSCRALGRGVEERLLQWLAGRAEALGCSGVRLAAERTPRNVPARRLVSALGGGDVDAPHLEVLAEPAALRSFSSWQNAVADAAGAGHG
jgi:FkbH-like protein